MKVLTESECPKCWERNLRPLRPLSRPSPPLLLPAAHLPLEICTFKFFSEEALVFLKKHNATKLANVYVQALVIIRDKRKKNSPANVLALANIRRKLWGTLRTKMRQSLGRYIRTLEAANFFMSHQH
jgi:hypothetical protein